MAADRTVSVKLKAEIEKYLADLRKAGKSTEDLGKRIDSAGKVASVAFSSLPAVAATASAGVATALGGASAAFIGLGAVALRNNTQVRQSFEDLSETIDQGIAQDAAPLADAFVDAADEIGSAYQRLRPELQDAFAASVPYVEDLTQGVIGFAEGAMPGAVDAVESAGPVFEGLQSTMAETGDATGDFLSILSEHSEEAGLGIQHLGDIVSGVLPNAGEIIGELTDLWAEHGDQVAQVVTQLSTVISDLATSALPGLSTSVGVALDVLSGVLTVIEPMTGVLGPVIGAWLSLTAAMKGIQTVRSIVDTVAGSVVAFGDKAKDSSRKARIAAGAFSALALAGSALESSFEDAPAQMDAFAEGLKRWAEQGKLSGEAARVFGGDIGGLSEAFSNLNHWARPATDILAGFAEMIPGVDTYMTTATKKVDALDSALATMVENGNGELAAQVFQKVAKVAKEAGVPIAELRDLLPQYSAAQEVAANKTQSAGEKMAGAVPGADALTEAMNTLSNKTATTAEHVDALKTAWEQLFGIQVTLEEAQAGFLEGLATIADTVKLAKENTNNWRAALINANGTINITTEVGRKLLANLGEQNEQYLTVAQTAYDTAIRQGKSQEMATQAAWNAVKSRKAAFIEEMVQLGLTEEAANRLFERYVGTQDLGDIVNQIVQPGMGAARSNARGYMQELNALDGKVVSSYVNILKTITTTQRTRPADGPFSGGRHGALPETGATGGLVAGGAIVQHLAPGGMVHGPGGPTADLVPAWLSNGEFVVNAAATSRNLDLLRAINSGQFARGGIMGSAGAAAPSPPSDGHGRDITVNIYNPIAEKASDSTQRRLGRMSELGMFS